jgi:hypothetical protein
MTSSHARHGLVFAAAIVVLVIGVLGFWLAPVERKDGPATPMAEASTPSPMAQPPPALLRDTLYHADGQIDGEVYEYGSIRQRV